MNMTVSLNIVWKLIATQYSGAVRFLSVNLVAYFCVAEVSDYFSVAFLIVSFISSISGVAISTQSYIPDRSVSTKLSMALIFGLTVLSSPVVLYFWDGNIADYMTILIVSLFCSMFEVFRSQLMAKGDFKGLAVRGVIGLLIMPLSVFLLKDKATILVFYVIVSMFLTVISRNCIVYSSSNRRLITKDVISYSLSNLFSTGFGFLFPLFLIQEFGDSSATIIAQVFTLSVIFFAYPRFLSATFLSKYKHEKDNALYTKFDKFCFIYSLTLTLVTCVVTYTMFPKFNEFVLFIISVICSQLALPASNLIMANGKGEMLLKVNLVSLSILIISIVVVKNLFEPDCLRAQILLVLYLLYQIGKYYILRGYVSRRFLVGCKNETV